MESRPLSIESEFASQRATCPDSEKAIDERVAEPTAIFNSDASMARRRMIAEAAYYRAQQRGFQPGYELEDWLAAENEIVRSWSDPTSEAGSR